jgi:hypothetical protein
VPRTGPGEWVVKQGDAIPFFTKPQEFFGIGTKKGGEPELPAV